MPGKDQAKVRNFRRSVNLPVVDISQRLHVLIPTRLIFGDVVEEARE